MLCDRVLLFPYSIARGIGVTVFLLRGAFFAHVNYFPESNPYEILNVGN